MFTHNIDPAFLHFGPFEIRYYGLFYVIGFIFAYFMIDYLSKQNNFKSKFKLGRNKIEDFLVYIGISGILGARLFYVLVYDLFFYLENPIEVLAIWHGGLSFHGALIGSIIGVYLFAKKNKYKFFDLLDIMAIPSALGLSLGRIGNFMNGELYGRITNVPWCVNFSTAMGCRHPSQIYEAIYSFLIFAVLWIINKKQDNKKSKYQLKSGTIAVTFILLYSTLRFFTEFFREADIQLGYFFGLTMGQILCILMFISGLILLRKIKN